MLISHHFHKMSLKRNKAVYINDSVSYTHLRRERRNELCADAFRWDDLKRWRALDQFKTTPYRTEGMRYWGSVYAVSYTHLKNRN